MLSSDRVSSVDLIFAFLLCCVNCNTVPAIAINNDFKQIN